jgi:hypothetical protein
VETDAAFGMARSVEDARGMAGDADGGSVFEGAVGRKDFGRGDADPGGLLIHNVELREIVLVEEDGGAGGFFEEGRAADVVDVGMGDDDLLQREFVLGEEGEDLGDAVAGVDDHGLAGGLVAEDGAIALEGADGEGFLDHGYFYCLPRDGGLTWDDRSFFFSIEMALCWRNARSRSTSSGQAIRCVQDDREMGRRHGLPFDFSGGESPVLPGATCSWVWFGRCWRRRGPSVGGWSDAA